MKRFIMLCAAAAMSQMSFAQSALDQLTLSERRVRQLSLNGAESVFTSTQLAVRDWIKASGDEIDAVATGRLCTRLVVEEAGDDATPEQQAAAEEAHIDLQQSVGRASLDASREMRVPTLLDGRASGMQSAYFLGLANQYVDGVMHALTKQFEADPDQRAAICSAAAE